MQQGGPVEPEGKSEEKPKGTPAPSSSTSSASVMRSLSTVDDGKRSATLDLSSAPPIATPLYRIGKDFVILVKERKDITARSTRLQVFKGILDEKGSVSMAATGMSRSTRAAPVPGKKPIDAKEAKGEIKKISDSKDLHEEDEKKVNAKPRVVSFPVALFKGKISYERGPLRAIAHWVGAGYGSSPAMQPIFKFFAGLKTDTNLTLLQLLQLTTILSNAHSEAKDSAPSKSAIEALMKEVAELAGIGFGGSSWTDCYKLQDILTTLNTCNALNMENLSSVCERLRYWDDILKKQLNVAESQITSKPEIASIICQQRIVDWSTDTEHAADVIFLKDIFSPVFNLLSEHSVESAENLLFACKNPTPQIIANLIVTLNYLGIFIPNQKRFRGLPQERLEKMASIFLLMLGIYNKTWQIPVTPYFEQITSFDEPKLFFMAPYVFDAICVSPIMDLDDIVEAYITLQSNDLLKVKEVRDLVLSSPKIAGTAINRNLFLLKSHPMMPVCLQLIIEQKYELANMLGSLRRRPQYYEPSILDSPDNCVKVNRFLKSPSCVFMATIVNSVEASVLNQENFDCLFNPSNEKHLPAIADLCASHRLNHMLFALALTIFTRTPQYKEDYISLLEFTKAAYLPYFEKFCLDPEKIQSAILPTLRFFEGVSYNIITKEILDIIFEDLSLALVRAKAFEFLDLANIREPDSSRYRTLIRETGIYAEEAVYGHWLLAMTRSPMAEYEQVLADPQYRPFLRGLAHGMVEIYKEPSINNPTSFTLLRERKEFAGCIATITCAVSQAGFMNPKNFETICDCAHMPGLENVFLATEGLTQTIFDGLIAAHKKLYDSGVVDIMRPLMGSRDLFDPRVLGIITRYIPPLIPAPTKAAMPGEGEGDEESEEGTPQSSPKPQL